MHTMHTTASTPTTRPLAAAIAIALIASVATTSPASAQGLLDRLRSVASRAAGDTQGEGWRADRGPRRAPQGSRQPAHAARHDAGAPPRRNPGGQPAGRVRRPRRRRALPGDRSDPGTREGRRSRDRSHRDRHRVERRPRRPDQLLWRRADGSGVPRLDGRDLRDRDTRAGLRAVLRRHADPRPARPRLGTPGSRGRPRRVPDPRRGRRRTTTTAAWSASTRRRG